MKFGKRRWEAKLETKPAGAAATPASDPIPQSWNVSAGAEPEPPSGSAPPPPEPVVDGEAVELPMTEVGTEREPTVVEPEPEPLPVAPRPPRAPGEPLPPPGASWAPAPMPFPVAEEPVLVYTSGSESPAVTPLADTGEAYASGHAPGTSPSWPEPVMALAAEKPEVVVGAAFAGGLLLAMILRRLGN
jgi:hypothetical protein